MLTEISPSLPTELKLFSAGVNETTKGPFLYNPLLAEYLTFHSHTADTLPIDINHLSFSQDTDVKNHRAVGYFKLEPREDGLWATEIEWTPEGQELLTNKAFKYTSPTFYVAEDGMTIVEIAGLSLTNNPATYGLDAIVANKINNFTKNKILELNKMFKNTKKLSETEEKPEDKKEEELVSLSQEEYDALVAEHDRLMAELEMVKTKLAEMEAMAGELKKLEDENKELMLSSLELETEEKEFWSTKSLSDVRQWVSLTKNKKNKVKTELNEVKVELKKETLPQTKNEASNKPKFDAKDEMIVNNIKARLNKIYNK